MGVVWPQGRGVLMQVLVDSSSPMQKRVAAYLMLMKEPRMTELEPLLRILSREPNQQFMGFVESHLNNIVSSTEPEGCVEISSHLHVFVFLGNGDLISRFLVPFVLSPD